MELIIGFMISVLPALTLVEMPLQHVVHQIGSITETSGLGSGLGDFAARQTAELAVKMDVFRVPRHTLQVLELERTSGALEALGLVVPAQMFAEFRPGGEQLGLRTERAR